MARESVEPLSIPAEQLWTVREAATILHIGRNAVYEMVKHDELPHVRIGSRVRFIPAALRAWIEKKQAHPPDAPPAEGSER